jgi:hypothetical protein
MKSKKGINFSFVIVAFLLGWTLIKHFDFTTYKFEYPVLDIIYLIVFIVSLYLIIKDLRKRPEK